MKWEKFEHQFDESWHNIIKPFIESEECDKIYAFLKKESARGKKIAPNSSDVFRCFKETKLSDLKVVLIGICPYHTASFNKECIADGLLLGCSKTGKLQPTLEQFYNGIDKELYEGKDLYHILDPDVSYLANQGVLMLNAALTTEINKAGSHLDVWEPFMKYIFENIFDVERVPIVFLGKEASKLKKYLPIFNWSFELSHPSSASYTHTEWETEGVFGKIDTILQENHNVTIEWLHDDMPF